MFTNSSIGATSYVWDFGDDSELSTEVNPEHDYANSDFGNHLVILTAIAPTGCVDTATRIIQVSEYLLFFIPNSFTPDGDNFNQKFQPVFTSGFDPYDFTLLIYDRWGEVLFESHDATMGWDGTYGTGDKTSLLPQGIYTWKIEFKSSKNDERKLYTGHLSLIR
jgi:gliding motility-associated-like protein